MYLARFTRPDILFPITYLATKAKNPTYLQSHRNYSYIFSGTSINMKVYCDASFGTHEDGRGHTGYAITLRSAPVFIHSGKQKFVALHLLYGGGYVDSAHHVDTVNKC